MGVPRITGVLVSLTLLQGCCCRPPGFGFMSMSRPGPMFDPGLGISRGIPPFINVRPDLSNVFLKDFSLQDGNPYAEHSDHVHSVVAGPHGSFYVLFGPENNFNREFPNMHCDMPDLPQRNQLQAPVVKVVMTNEEPIFSNTTWGANFLEMPVKMVMDDAGSMWFLDIGRQQVLKQEAEGSNVSLTIGTKHSVSLTALNYSGLCMPQDIALSSEGYVFIADGCYCMRTRYGEVDGARILMFDKAGNFIRDLTHNLTGTSPLTSLTFDERDRNLYVGKSAPGRVYRVQPTTGNVTSVMAESEKCTERNWRLAKPRLSDVLFAASKHDFTGSRKAFIYSITTADHHCRVLKATSNMYDVADMAVSQDGKMLFVVTNTIKGFGRSPYFHQPHVYIFNKKSPAFNQRSF